MGMSAEVSSLIRLIDANEPSDSPIGKPTATIDLLALDSKELDLDLQVPCGWEKRLDLKSGKISLQRCNSSPASDNGKSRPLSLFEDESSKLDLKLSSGYNSNYHQSVCTLDKVKSALERAEREGTRKRSVSSISMSPSSSFRSNSSSSVKDGLFDFDQEERSVGPTSSTASFAVGCPSCLMYVLVTKACPKCPRCYCEVPLPGAAAAKRPRIDLNISI